MESYICIQLKSRVIFCESDISFCYSTDKEYLFPKMNGMLKASSSLTEL